MRLRSTLIYFFSVLVFSAFTQQAFAQESTALSVSPVTFELSGNPGDILTNQVKVTNISSAKLDLEAQIENITGTGDEGQVKLAEEAGPFALSNWVKTNPREFTLKSQESRTITFSITIPKNAEPGGHYGTILIGTISRDKLDTTGAAIVQRVGSLLLVKVSGKAKEEAFVNSFKVQQFKGGTTELLANDGKTKIIVPQDEQTNFKNSQKYFQSGPVGFEILFKNNGNVHVKPQGFITVYNIFHRKVAELQIDQKNIFPSGQRKIVVVWPQKSLWGIYYSAQLGAIYGSPSQNITGQVSFWAFPIPALITAIVVILLLLVLRKRLARAIRILVKGS